MSRSPSQPQRPTADVLLVTVTEVEAQTILRIFRKQGRNFIGDKTYYDLGIISGARTAMVQSEMGSGGPGGSLLTVWEGIQALSPATVIMVGIAYGLNPSKQQMGDILVSQQIRDYKPRKVKTGENNQLEVVLRGDLVSGSIRLLDRFKAGAKEWSELPRIHFGLLLSGEDLINNATFRNQLHHLEPEAIGGEMEGAGLYSAASRRSVDWIIVKAICDWADGDKEDTYQQQAAENAARFTLHVIKQGGLKREEAGVITTPLGTTLLSYEGHSHWVLTLDWSPNGLHIVSAGADATAQVWNTSTGERLLTYRRHAYTDVHSRTKLTPSIYTVAWSPTGRRIASAGTGKNVQVWQPDGDALLLAYKNHSGFFSYVFTLAWSPDGTRIASACSTAGWDKTLHIWDASTGLTILQCDPHQGRGLNFSTLALAWSPDGTRIAATCGDKTLHIWDARTGKQLAAFKVHQDASALAWSPDSKIVATASSDASAQLWDATTGELLLTYNSHSYGIRSIIWSPDGTSIATASNDHTVQIWDAASGHHIYTYKGHTDWVTSVAWSPDGSRIASGSNDKSVKIWQAE